MSRKTLPQFNIQVGDQPTRNVPPILHEVRHALKKLLDTGETSTIDIRAIPLAPGEEQTIIEALGQGEVHARLEALGPSEIVETKYSGIWLITHCNEAGSIISRTIEIAGIPGILKSQPEDMHHALEALAKKLATDESKPHVEVAT